MKIIVIIIAALHISIADCVDVFPSSIDRCRNEDKDCLLKAWNKYIKLSGEMDAGITELSVRNLHEYFIDKMAINVGGEAVNLKLVLTNSTLIGLDTITLNKITEFPRDPKLMSKFELLGHIPLVNISGNYKTSGKVLLLPLSGDGYIELQLFNITFKITVETKTEVKDKEEYLVISNVRCTYKSERNHYRLDNLLNNKELSDSINKIFNENQDVINKDLVSPISSSISKIFKKIFVPIFKRYPYRSFFLEA